MSENHETCWDVVISYVEAMIKILEDFMHVVTYDAYKPGHLYLAGLGHLKKKIYADGRIGALDKVASFAECLPDPALGKGRGWGT